MSRQQYSWLGLNVACDLPLLAAAAPADTEPDVTVVESLDLRPAPNRDDELVAERKDATFGYRATRSRAGYLLDVGAAGALLVDPELARITVYRSAADIELMALLVMGLGFAFLLGLRGDVVLHASAVVDDGRATLLMGSTGSGKSTLAGLLCSRGAALVADDSVRLMPGARGWTALGGGTEVRLRSGAAAVSDLISLARVRQAVDGRRSVGVPRVQRAGAPVKHIAIPRIGDVTGVQRLEGAAALRALLRGVRLGGWCQPRVLERQTKTLARLAREVPIYVVQLERSRNFDAARAESVRRALIQLA